ncbi:hypothetical protein L596_011028 [Steinernema carpocapsae]|uniref:Uncharacterized protein n=1 Tax=Steinernema carpocapsae TaxID=34508 RepID=A0A4V6A4F0_STECR|nr:hypothetical protein L596_011028 [Steinernema carpocapsae]
MLLSSSDCYLCHRPLKNPSITVLSVDGNCRSRAGSLGVFHSAFYALVGRCVSTKINIAVIRESALAEDCSHFFTSPYYSCRLRAQLGLFPSLFGSKWRLYLKSPSPFDHIN